MKIVINKCYGGFHLSPEAVEYYYGLKGRKAYHFVQDHNFPYPQRVYKPANLDLSTFITSFDIPNPNEFVGDPWDENFLDAGSDIDRADPDLIKTVEALGDRANSDVSKLRIVEIPDGTEYTIDDYDGNESIHETHSSWS